MTDQAKTGADEQVIKTLLSLKKVTAFFQPIISIAAKRVIGFEAFARPVGEYSSIDPRVLFDGGYGADIMLEMDRLCRVTALHQFKAIHDRHKEMLLFLKTSAGSLPHLDVGKLQLEEELEEAGVDLSSVVLELPLVVDHMEDSAPLFQKLHSMKAKVCLDNCSLKAPVSYALNLFKPEFMKLGRSFFTEGTVSHSSATLSGAIRQANLLGVQVIGLGVENEEESVRLMSAGVHLQQGYFYSKDEDNKPDDTPKLLLEKIVKVGRRFLEMRQEGVRRTKEGFATALSRAGKIAIKLSNMPEPRFGDACRALVAVENGPLSLFVLDAKGIQITDRPCAEKTCVFNVAGAIYGSQRGTDHSSEDYALYIEMGYNQFVTPPFTSLVSGQEACLISKPFYNAQGERYTMCVEMEYPG
ncbi:EAL domain-containing protein [uncultured Pseudodesulfovibrio sp.]|uniref:EAL domain-containing protein n=1 Tax=uncultured Pseudodesulfovibrio sp. TaxID=2035858 RepID=UPI0029C61DC2|nr:EAL domain-containing protein [uncultured Pseudodesulfovibrio sp.]